jgi:hypothetical protein
MHFITLYRDQMVRIIQLLGTGRCTRHELADYETTSNCNAVYSCISRLISLGYVSEHINGLYLTEKGLLISKKSEEYLKKLFEH